MAVDPTNLARYPQQPEIDTCVVTAAVTGLGTDTPTGLVLLAQAGAKGAIIKRIWAIPRANVTPSCLVLFISHDNGATYRLIDSETMALQTLSTTVGIAETPFANYTASDPLNLGPNDRLYVGSMVAAAGGIVFKAQRFDMVAAS